MDRDRERAVIVEASRNAIRVALRPLAGETLARIALRGATVAATQRGEDPARANVRGNVYDAACESAPLWGRDDGKRAEARTPRTPGDGRAWAPMDRAVNGGLHRVRPTAHDDSREGARTLSLDLAHTARLDSADRARALIAKAQRAGAPREILRAMRDRASRGFPVEAWEPTAKGRPVRPVVGVYRAR